MNCGILLAGGKGKRMNSQIPKQYLSLRGYPVLYYSLKAFEESDIDEIIIVASKDYMDYIKNDIVLKYEFKKVKAYALSGKERMDSVKNGLLEVENCEYVLIHDGARPMVSPKLINDCLKEVKKYKAIVTGTPLKDTIRWIDDKDFGGATLDRSRLRNIQTPQGFLFEEIKAAHLKLQENRAQNEDITDDAMVLERFLGRKSVIIMGDYKNIKITTAEDLIIAGAFLDEKEKNNS
ncbi:2-C-methyl-D-erythritol 4-phosphate cytidylyltransferase [Acetitomaculum ruminis DSM 5522]|uniref:2-C-methyl-D-erythritol 4-phosphate cytidylyltransferase n=1 Tax=Acetitomaculum ruminis DSM 5522 TaxID=1120918 RepID=A0A1I0Z6Z1_9FIRM|nr:2-C-methyl-D-erythritol 4-phosphate cytidylyltransferase [Acetitomaculum ruminis]SFB21395.1 2-C-methyl-D-erythritol 4-phosphate cytidylyltransferase [Acetitomaculum ruminis DSM 5522]